MGAAIRASLLAAALCAGVVLGCGQPIDGTESGNPITPTRPPSYEPDLDDSDDIMGGFDAPPVAEGPTAQADPPPVEPADDTPLMPAAPSEGPSLAPASPPGEQPMPVDAAPPADPVAASCSVAQCEQQASDAAARLGAPAPPPASFDDPICSSTGSIFGCQCDSITRIDSSVQCVQSDRFGRCLYPGFEFPGCTPDEDDCGTICADLHQRQVDESAMSHMVDVLGSACVNMTCRYALAVDSQCFVGEPLQLIDCDLADEVLRP